MKTALTLLGFAGLGFGVGFYIGERYGMKKQREQEDNGVVVSFIPDEKLEEAAETYAPPVTAATDIDLEQAHKDMDAYMSTFEHPTEEDQEEEDRRNVPKKPDETFIQIIDPDIYDAETEFAPHEWSYYEQDHILCDEDNERIENPEDYVGTMIEDIFYEYPDKDVLYVRNSWLGEKFQITRLNDSYARAVEGMDADFEVYPGFNGMEE